MGQAHTIHTFAILEARPNLPSDRINKVPIELSGVADAVGNLSGLVGHAHEDRANPLPALLQDHEVQESALPSRPPPRDGGLCEGRSELYH